MVTPPFCPGLNVEILVDDEPLEEYDDIDESQPPPNTITKYIDAKSDEHFAVRLGFDDDFLFPEGDMEVETLVDGETEDLSHCESRHRHNSSGVLIAGRSVRLSTESSAVQRFRFAAIQIVEIENQQSPGDLEALFDSLGSISVRLRFIKNVRDYEEFCPEEDRVKTGNSNSFSKVSSKGHTTSHCARLGSPVPHEVDWQDWDHIGNVPFVTVNFNYRSLDMLRILGINPREPTPLPLEQRPEEELNNDELRQVVRLLKEEREATIRIKKEVANKRARSRSVAAVDDETPRRKHHRRNHEVIELD